jgi:hypothetical protein
VDTPGAAWGVAVVDLAYVADGESGLLIYPAQCGGTVAIDETYVGPATVAAAAPSLEPPYPNPFSTHTSIRLDLPNAGRTDVAICDVTGRVLRRLASAAFPRGSHSIDWDGSDNEGRPVASGVYFCRVETGRKVLTTKLVLLSNTGGGRNR